MKYATGSAFRQALEERIRDIHSERNIPIVRLRKEVAFERLIARLIRYQPNYWVLKGGLALQLRLGMHARTTKDVDLLSTSTFPTIYNSLADAAKIDLMDWFSYEIERPGDIVDKKFGGNRNPVRCFFDGRIFENIYVDVGVSDIVLEPYDWLSFDPTLDFAGIQSTIVPCHPYYVLGISRQKSL
jgi:hypothetical protein